jgi:hypothetical protein
VALKAFQGQLDAFIGAFYLLPAFKVPLKGPIVFPGLFGDFYGP